MKLDSSFNLTYYHENFRNPDVLLHQPDFYSQVDINNDGSKEILNLGEAKSLSKISEKRKEI